MYWWVNREWTPKEKECSDEATKKAQGLHGIVSPFYWDSSSRPNGRPNQPTDRRTENTKKSRDSAHKPRSAKDFGEGQHSKVSRSPSSGEAQHSKGEPLVKSGVVGGSNVRERLHLRRGSTSSKSVSPDQAPEAASVCGNLRVSGSPTSRMGLSPPRLSPGAKFYAEQIKREGSSEKQGKSSRSASITEGVVESLIKLQSSYTPPTFVDKFSSQGDRRSLSEESCLKAMSHQGNRSLSQDSGLRAIQTLPDGTAPATSSSRDEKSYAQYFHQPLEAAHSHPDSAWDSDVPLSLSLNLSLCLCLRLGLVLGLGLWLCLSVVCLPVLSVCRPSLSLSLSFVYAGGFYFGEFFSFWMRKWLHFIRRRF